jgi:hypothetical protein
VIPEQLIEIKVASNTKAHYVSLGYDCKKGDIIKVCVSHLMPNSMAIETRVCDCCNKSYSAPH